ncbi:MAG: hypothetical protein LBV67_06230 [Streptococcaceae bacterium]|jgi:hypothetical protein|nr:hypothetical protein [Streptococcaceae bacterium]
MKKLSDYEPHATQDVPFKKGGLKLYTQEEVKQIIKDYTHRIETAFSDEYLLDIMQEFLED